MEQPQLNVFADFSIPPETIRQTIAEVRLLDWSEIAGDEGFRNGFMQFPEAPEEQITYLGTNQDGDSLLQWCGISIRISRHLIAFSFPVLFKTWRDYAAFRIGLNRFLCTFLRPFQCGNLLFFPSKWQLPAHRIRNEWHQKRLEQMQRKITSSENSFKRGRLHLAYCLGEAATDPDSASLLSYHESGFFKIDAGRLCCIAALEPAKDAEALAETAKKIGEGCAFTCRPLFRDNACAFAIYSRKVQCKARPCRLQPDYDPKKYPDFRTAVISEGVARWNASCFFSLDLHPSHLTVRFRKTVTELLYGSNKKECLDLLRELLAPLHPKELLLCSHTLLDEASETNDFKEILAYLQQHYTGYSDLDDIASWNLAFIHGGW